jgi:hypothetical protein
MIVLWKQVDLKYYIFENSIYTCFEGQQKSFQTVALIVNC